MAIALQAAPTVVNGSWGRDGGNTLTTSVVVAAGKDTVLVVSIQNEGDATGQQDVSVCTYNGVACGFFGKAEHADWSQAELWYLVDPADGTHSLTVTISPGSTNHGVIGAYVFDGVRQSNPFRTPVVTDVGSSATAATVTVPGVQIGDVLIDSLSIDAPGHFAAVGANQVEQWDRDNTGHEGASSTQDGVDGGVMSWSWTTAGAYALVAGALIPADNDVAPSFVNYPKHKMRR